MNGLPTVKMKKAMSPNKGSSLFDDYAVIRYGEWAGGMNDRALLAIVSALDGYTEPPGLDWPDHEKEEVTFSRWVLEEILNLVWDHPWTLASDTIEKFAWKLELYAATAVTEEQKRIFDVAAETAYEFLEEIKEVER